MADVPRRALRLLTALPTLLLMLWLGGCTALLPEPEPAPSRFDLGPWSEPAPIDADLAGVRVQSLRAASWLNVAQISYRQLHRRPEAVHHYAAHAWIAPPPEMLAVRLEQMLASDGDARERWRLEVELLSFEQVFTSSQDARATIMLRASLRERGGDDRIHQRSFIATEPVTADVDGAIEGLPKVADAALRELVAWAADVTTSR
ncbi:MAG: membrane integrity-associated transporter subunit PqiC [Gammaproteobacteria bacterium]|nr:membrane integrity-associated transporter subunit PqiC [Gammaproteobacteria bacterium]